MITHLVRLLAEYVATLALLARTEAGQDFERLSALIKRRMISAGVALLGLLWVNVALVLWLLQTDWPVIGAFAIAAAALGAAWFLGRSPGGGADGVLAQTREVVRAEMHAMGIGTGDAHAPDGSPLAAPVETLSPAGARARLRAIRVEVGLLLAPPERADLPGMPGSAGEPGAAGGFSPRSRTMRLLMNVWGGPPETGAVGTVLGSLVGFLALRSRRLRRLAAFVGIARNLTRMVGRRLRRA